ncbi:hypothetical protein BJ170DRAFT_36675 [Xylariales sp. AK1849]|nr:hypothetical protein BJ170DRAFT_36675 [Xylariales sp. AK1849]
MASASRLFTRSRTRSPKFSSIRQFSEAAQHPSNRVQVYISRSRDPYLNLSIEHYLLQKSNPASVVLLLYTNRPCVVIGRNQNPWLEVNLNLLNRPGLLAETQKGSGDAGVELVRRRSGGGTVFHDEGNVNYSVICPPADFDRDRHAEMVVRALQTLDAKTTRVNERHDIVVDVPGDSGQVTYKISGSAYKLTRLRSLHHGTCLLSTPNLDRIGQFLHSPAAPYIMARGVESVRSRIRNVGVENRAFEEAVVAEFGSMYGNVDIETISDDEARGLTEVVKGYKELKSDEWTYQQTPLFTFSSHPTEKDMRKRPSLPDYLPPWFQVNIEARHGEIIAGNVVGKFPCNALEAVHLHKVDDWRTYIGEPGGRWLNEMFGVRPG